MLADGRFEDMKSLFNFYHRVLSVSKARTKAWFFTSSLIKHALLLRKDGSSLEKTWIFC